MKADVLKNLTNGDLTIETVTKAVGLSGRQAQRLFASSGMTFSEFVLEQRLLLARGLLLHEAGRNRKVSQSASTISRIFIGRSGNDSASRLTTCG